MAARVSPIARESDGMKRSNGRLPSLNYLTNKYVHVAHETHTHQNNIKKICPKDVVDLCEFIFTCWDLI